MYGMGDLLPIVSTMPVNISGMRRGLSICGSLQEWTMVEKKLFLGLASWDDLIVELAQPRFRKRDVQGVSSQ